MSRRALARTYSVALAALVVSATTAGLLLTSNLGQATMDYQTLVQRLRATGATVEPSGEVEQPFFAVQGRSILVNGAPVQVFEYSDAAGASRDAAKVSSDGSEIGTAIVTWVGTPHFYTAGRLIVLYVGEDKTVTDPLEAVLGAQFAGGTSRPPPETREVPFETVASGAMSAHEESRNYVITNEGNWTYLWNRISSNQIPLPHPPTVDFSENTVIAVFQGTKATGGYGIEILRITETDSGLLVSVKETSPGSECFVTQALTAPYHIVKIPKVDKETQFTVEQAIVDCPP